MIFVYMMFSYRENCFIDIDLQLPEFRLGITYCKVHNGTFCDESELFGLNLLKFLELYTYNVYIYCM